MLVTFDETLHTFTNNCQQLVVAEGQTKDVLMGVFSTFPQLYVHLFADTSEAAKIALILNDEELLEEADSVKFLCSEDTLHLCVLPYGNGDAVVSSIVWAIGSVAGEVAVNATTYAVVEIVLQMAAMMVLSAIMGALVGDIASPDANMGVANSSTYTFDGVKNTTYSGAPLFLVYGTHRVGGTVINVFTSYNYIGKALFSNLHMQIGLCEGEVESVRDIYINKTPSSFFNGVATPDIRMGTSDQEAMYDFNRVENTISYGRKIITLETPVAISLSTTTKSAEPVYGVVADGKIYEGYYEPIREYVGIMAP